MKSRNPVLFSVFLTLVLSFLASPCSVRALSREEALSWIRSQEGKALDLDGRYGAQCSDLATAYLNYLLTGDAWGNVFGVYDGEAYARALARFSQDFLVLSPCVSPLPGDLFVSAGGDSHGHVGLILEPEEGGALVLDQNSRASNYTTGSPGWLHRVRWEGCYALRALIRFLGFEKANEGEIYPEAWPEEVFFSTTPSPVPSPIPSPVPSPAPSTFSAAFSSSASSLTVLKNRRGKLTLSLLCPYAGGGTEVSLLGPKNELLKCRRTRKKALSFSGLTQGETLLITWRFYLKKNGCLFYDSWKGPIALTLR